MACALAAATASAGCGSGGTDPTTGAAAEEAVTSLLLPDGLDAGCGPEARTDPDDLAADRAVARCAPGAPRPQPLAEPARLVVGVQARGREVAPLLAADEHGELSAENLDVDVVVIPEARELYAALGRGEVDAVVGDLDAPFFDQVSAGTGIQVVAGGPVAQSAGVRGVPQAGLWVRDDALSAPEQWNDLVGQRVGLPDGLRAAAVWPVDDVLRQLDISLDGVQVVDVAGTAAASQLRDGRLVAAWLDDEAVDRMAGVPGFSVVATPPLAESLGGVVVAASLTDPARRRDVGLAFIRALVRTSNTHVAEADGSYVHDWELRTGTTDRLQDAFLWHGTVRYDRAIPESQLADRSLYSEVVGAEIARAHDDG
jgi:NitT/TauT family transport system substrate-binding protein